MRTEESVRRVWVWTDYDPFVKNLGRFLVGFAFWSLRPWGWIVVVRWRISCPVKTVGEKEEEMRGKERGGTSESFLLVQLLLTALLPLNVLVVEWGPLIEDLLGCSGEHVLHRRLDRRALPGPHGAHRVSFWSAVVVVKITERSVDLPDSETMNSLTAASCLMT